LKLDRLLAITMLLLNRKRVSAKELAERFEVSLRTVYRDLETINQAGIPIVSYPGLLGGYELTDRYRLDRQLLTLDELQSIIVALRGVRTSLDEQDVGRLLDKVGALVTHSERGSVEELSEQLIIDINPWRGNEAEKETLRALRAAIQGSRLVRFAYTSSQGDSTGRVCEPMGVVLKGYIWYLYGYCRLRQDYRIFRLTRIERLEQLPDTFVRRPQKLEQLDYRWARREERAYARLVLRFQPRAKARVQDYFRQEQIVTEPGGTLLVTAVQPEEPWLYSMLLGYGADVQVLEPESVAQAVLAMAREVVRLYETETLT
jgi:predicted DNA-binding transcriptional regulator YafY